MTGLAPGPTARLGLCEPGWTDRLETGDKVMKFRVRRTLRFGPFRLNFTQSGFSSWSFHMLRFSYNSRTGWRYDTPGPGYLELGGKRRTRRS